MKQHRRRKVFVIIVLGMFLISTAFISIVSLFSTTQVPVSNNAVDTNTSVLSGTSLSGSTQ